MPKTQDDGKRGLLAHLLPDLRVPFVAASDEMGARRSEGETYTWFSRSFTPLGAESGLAGKDCELRETYL